MRISFKDVYDSIDNLETVNFSANSKLSNVMKQQIWQLLCIEDDRQIKRNSWSIVKQDGLSLIHI